MKKAILFHLRRLSPAWLMVLPFAISGGLEGQNAGRYRMDPTNWLQGKTFDVTITDTACTDNSSTAGLDTANFDIPTGFGVDVDTAGVVANARCTKVVRVKVNSDAQLGNLPVRLTWKGDGKTEPVILMSSIVAVLPGAIPPGLTPQVDALWYVVPEGIARDNYGKRIGSAYYVLDVALGNNSGYDILVSSIGFAVQQATGTDKYVELKLPSTSYKIARATLEKEQQVGLRAIVVNVVRSLGPVGTGIVPFFHSAGPKSNFTQGVDLFSNPFEKGLELVWPDTTIRHLDRLDDQVLRDGTIIHNNDQVRTRVLLPKTLIRAIASTSTGSELPTEGDRTAKRKAPSMTMVTGCEGKSWKSTSRVHKINDAECNELRTVNAIFNRMILIGNTIEYRNRVHIASGEVRGEEPPPTIGDLKPHELTADGSAATVQVTGLHLTGVRFGASDSKITIGDNPTIDASGQTATIQVTVGKDEASGVYYITASKNGATARFPITVKKP